MNNLNLASVEKAFEEWRCRRYSRSEPIPEDLWSMALGLYPQYKRSRICDVLRLSGTQFKQRLEGSGDTRLNSGFVLASHDEVKASRLANTEIQLTLQGQARSITLCFDMQALGQVLSQVDTLL